MIKERLCILISGRGSNLLSIIKKFDIIFLTESLSIMDYLEGPKKFSELNNQKFYFIAHGLTGYYIEDKQAPIFKAWNNVLSENNNFNIITCCNYIEKHLSSSKSQVIKVNYIPQFLNNDAYYNNTPNSQLKYLNESVVIFPVLHNKNIDVAIITQVIKELASFNKNFIIKLKPKINYKEGSEHRKIVEEFQLYLRKSVSSIKGVNVTINSDSNNAKYFHCEKVITLNGGTSFLESLTYNNKTFNIEFNENVRYQNIPISSNKLLICKNIEEFRNKLILTKDNSYFDECYEKDKEELFRILMDSKIKKENMLSWESMTDSLILR